MALKIQSEPKIQSYAEFSARAEALPFPIEGVVKVENRDPKGFLEVKADSTVTARVPGWRSSLTVTVNSKDALRFRFFDAPVTTINSGNHEGQRRNYTNWYYIGGDVMTFRRWFNNDSKQGQAQRVTIGNVLKSRPSYLVVVVRDPNPIF